MDQADNTARTDTTPDSSPTSTARHGRRWSGLHWRGRLAISLGALAATLGLLLGGAYWLLATPSGLAASLTLAVQLSDDALQIEGARGRLLGPLHIDRLSWTPPADATDSAPPRPDQAQQSPPTLALSLTDLKLDWQPAALLQGQLQIQQLSLGSLRLTPGPEDAEAEAPPEQLTLPLAIELHQLELGALYLNDASTPLLENLQARLKSDADTHQLQQLQLTTAGLTLAASATLHGTAPMQLQTQATLHGQLEGQDLALQLNAQGPLARLPVTGRIVGGGSQGQLEALLTPFAALPLEYLSAQLQDIDPSRWQAGSPHARLDLDARLVPLPGADLALSGHFTLHNHRPAGLDAQGLPLEKLAAELRWQDQRLELANIELLLPRHGKAPQGRFHGKFAGNFGNKSGNTSGDKFAATSPDKAPDTSAGTSSAAETRAAPHFSLSGELQQLDPAVLATTWPSGRISSRLEAALQLAAAPGASQLQLQFALQESQLAGQRFSGQGEVVMHGARLQHSQVRLTAGPNQLELQGALGAAADVLHIKLDAPRLESLGLPGQLAGDVAARLQLAGAYTALRLNGTANSRQLRLPGAVSLQGLNLETRMGSQPDDALTARLQLTQLEHPDIVLDGTQLQLSGSRRQHSLALETGLSLADQALFKTGQLRLSATGGLSPTQDWRGTLQTLELIPAQQPALLRLKTPATLDLGARRLLVTALELEGALQGAPWQASLQQLARQDERWQSRGQLHALPLAPLLAQALPPPARISLSLSGAWDVQLGERLGGNLTLRRQSGDLQLGASPATALGLQEAEVSLDLDSRPRLQAQVRGTRLGQLNADLQFSQRDPLENPWQGQLTARMDDLAWLAPLAGPQYQLGGRLAGRFALAGTPRQPQVQGELKGEALSLRALDLGLRLESGQVQLALQDNTLRLENLHFQSLHGPLPRDLQNADRDTLAALVSRPGEIHGKGSLKLAPEPGGKLEFQLDRVGVIQKPNQWVLLSGQAELGLAEQMLAAVARLVVDGAFWELAEAGAPQLSDDVEVQRLNQAPRPAPALKTRLDVRVDLGRAFHFAGAGVRTRLRGDLHVQGQGQEPPRATGTIRTVAGRFDAYGQQLDIDQGILTFNGLVQNPGLNIRALRKNLPVEAGVSISGTAQRPVIKLISNPSVPDAEKLSWLVLGEAPEQRSGADYGTLLTAANAILGGQGSGPGSVLADLQKALGVNVSVGRGSSGPAATSQVASSSGFGASSQTASGQVLKVGTRIANGLNLSYEQSLAGTESVVKLTLALGRNLSLVGQAGTDNAVDLFYNFRFGSAGGRRQERRAKPAPEPAPQSAQE